MTKENKEANKESQFDNAAIDAAIEAAVNSANATEQQAQETQPVLTPLEEAQKSVSDLTDMLKRKQAEFENYQKRMDLQSNQLVAFSAQRVITKLIPIIDMFELSLKHKDNVEEFITGVEMIFHSFEQILNDERVSRPSLVGQKFDPRLAQAVGTRVVKGTPAGIVLEETSKCYVLNERTIKHARVIVSALPNNSSEQSQENKETKK